MLNTSRIGHLNPTTPCALSDITRMGPLDAVFRKELEKFQWSLTERQRLSRLVAKWSLLMDSLAILTAVSCWISSPSCRPSQRTSSATTAIITSATNLATRSESDTSAGHTLQRTWKQFGFCDHISGTSNPASSGSGMSSGVSEASLMPSMPLPIDLFA